MVSTFSWVAWTLNQPMWNNQIPEIQNKHNQLRFWLWRLQMLWSFVAELSRLIDILLHGFDCFNTCCFLRTNLLCPSLECPKIQTVDGPRIAIPQMPLWSWTPVKGHPPCHAMNLSQSNKKILQPFQFHLYFHLSHECVRHPPSSQKSPGN